MEMNQLHIYGAKTDCKDLKVILCHEKNYRRQKEKPCLLLLQTRKAIYCVKDVLSIDIIRSTFREKKTEDVPMVC